MKQLAVLLFAVSTAFAQSDAALALSNQGLDAYDHHDYSGAERLDREAIAKWEALGTAYEAHLGITRMNLAQALAVLGRRAESQAELRQSVALLRRTLGTHAIQTLIAMNLLAGLDLMMGDDAGAQRLVDEALPIAREIDPAGVQSSRALAAQACLRLRDKRFDEALPLADEAIRIAIQATGEDSIDTALVYGTAAEVHRAAGRPERALPLYRRARAIYEKRLGPQDTRVASILSQEALILIDDRKYALAEQSLKRSFDILDHSCPACAVERWSAESALGLLRTRQGKYAEADRLFTRLLAVQESAQPEPFADIAVTLNALAFIRRKEHLFEDADRLTNRAAALSFH
jgi:tetratricopeptide (TPR) repeat protein